MSSGYPQSKRLATIGSLLLLIPALNIIGILLVVIGMKGLAKYYKVNHIYRDSVIGAILGIVGLISITLNMIAIIIAYANPNALYVPIGLYFLVILFSLSLMALFFQMPLKTLSKHSGEHLFRTAGNLMLIGTTLPTLCLSLLFILTQTLHTYINATVMTLLISTGLIIVHLAFIIMALAFSSLKPTQLTCHQQTTICPHCGTSLSSKNTSVEENKLV